MPTILQRISLDWIMDPQEVARLAALQRAERACLFIAGSSFIALLWLVTRLVLSA